LGILPSALQGNARDNIISRCGSAVTFKLAVDIGLTIADIILLRIKLAFFLFFVILFLFKLRLD